MKLTLGALLVAGLILTGCDGLGGGIGEPNISVYGASFPPRVGEKLRAFSSGAEFTGDSDFIWEYSDKREDGYWHEIRVGSVYYGYYGTVSSENDKEFTIEEGLAGFYLRVRRKTKAADNMQGVWVYSDIIGRIQKAE
jgi:hypothetical protein